MGDTEQVEREVEHLRVVITRLGSAQSDGKSEKQLRDAAAVDCWPAGSIVYRNYCKEQRTRLAVAASASRSSGSFWTHHLCLFARIHTAYLTRQFLFAPSRIR